MKRFNDFFKDSSKITESSDPMVAPVKPKVSPDTRPLTKPFNPLKPSAPKVMPRPKNYTELAIYRTIKKLNSLLKINENIEELAPDFFKEPERKKINLERTNEEIFKALGYISIYEANYTDEEKINIAKEIVFNIFKDDEKIMDIQSLNFDLEIIYDYIEVKNHPEPTDEDSLDQEVKDSINKRKIINLITQDFSMLSKEEFFKDDLESVKKMESILITKYMEFIKMSIDSQPTQKEIYDAKKMTIAYAERHNYNGLIAAGQSEVIEDKKTGNYTIKAKAINIVLLVQEIVKGIMELFSYSAQDDSKEIIKKYNVNPRAYTETWGNEQIGFIFGPKVVSHMKTIFEMVESNLIKTGKITKYAPVMLVATIANINRLPNKDFLDFYINHIFVENITNETIEIMSGYYMDTLIAFGKGDTEAISSFAQDKKENDAIISAMEKATSDRTDKNSAKEKELMMDELLDDLNKVGGKIENLPQYKQDQLRKLSENKKIVLSFNNWKSINS